MMSVSIDDEGTTAASSKARRHGRARSALVFFLWVIVISAELALLVSVHQAQHSPPRKSGSFQKVNVHAPPGGTPSHHHHHHHPHHNHQPPPLEPNGNSPDTLYEEEKRLVHTGPNPLHN